MTEYAVVFERGPRNWSAYVPDLPGCIATGKTRDETEQRLREAIEMHLRAMAKDGDPIPEPISEVGKVQVV